MIMHHLFLSFPSAFLCLGFFAAATDLLMKKMQNESEGLPHGMGKQEETSMAFKATAGTV